MKDQSKVNQIARAHQLISEKTTSGIIITDVADTITWVNNRFTELTGYSFEEAVGRNPGELLQGKDTNPKTVEVMKAAVEKFESFKVDILNYHKDGTPIWISVFCDPIFGEDGKPEGFIAIQPESTQYKMELQKKNEELERLNQEKVRLFSIIAHDLRAPLSELYSILGLLRSGDIQQDEFSKFVDLLGQNVDEKFHLIDNVLKWASSQLDGLKVKTTSFDLKELIDFQVSEQSGRAQEVGISIVNNLDSSLHIHADRDINDVIFRNLLSNAVKFCEAGDSILIGVRAEEEAVIISVTDSGPGIPLDQQGHIFEVSYTTSGPRNQKGVGLGLSLCKDFAEKQGGTIWMNSELGKGSKFSFSIPSLVLEKVVE